jgi:hypothetical protein
VAKKCLCCDESPSRKQKTSEELNDLKGKLKEKLKAKTALNSSKDSQK